MREWVAHHSGAWTTADDRRLADWLAADPAHRQAYQRVSQLWEAAGDLRLPVPASSARCRHPLFLRRHASALAAALIVAVLFVPVGVQLKQWWDGVPHRVVVRIAEQKTLQLPDGSSIVLDADSELIYQVGYGRRRATLQRGEALFSVAHDARRPFEVTAGAGRMIDLGTTFDLEVRHGAVRVSVLEGHVGIVSTDGALKLAAGQRAGYDTTGVLSTVGPADESVADWRNGRRVFHDMPLGRVLEYFERYHSVRIELSDPALRKLHVSGVFRMTDLRTFLATLQGSFPIHVRWVDAGHIELRPAS
ncbi:MAG TPA: FecR domain-containing protein [Nitrospiria bacterium]|nr:FecR domain-containing protein [Nitrospiria bacterium]